MPSFSTPAIELIQKPSFRTAAIGFLKFSYLGLFPHSPLSACLLPFSPSPPVAQSGPIAVSCAELFLPGGRPPSRPPTQVKLFPCSVLIFYKWVLLGWTWPLLLFAPAMLLKHLRCILTIFISFHFIFLVLMVWIFLMFELWYEAMELSSYSMTNFFFLGVHFHCS